MILLLIASLQVAGSDSIPRVTLADALRLSLRIDPSYVSASGGIDNAAWQKRSTRSRFFVPSLALQTTVTEFSTEIFNVGTGIPTRILDVAWTLCEGMGLSPHVTHEFRPGDVRHCWADNSKAAEDLGKRDFTTIKLGLQLTRQGAYGGSVSS